MKRIKVSIPDELMKKNGFVLSDKTLIVVNTLRKEKQLVNWVAEEFYDKVDVQSVWVKKVISEHMTAFGPVHLENTEVYDTEPIISNDYMNVVFIDSKDTNLLKYIEYELKKRLEVRKELNSVYKLGEPALDKKGELNLPEFIKQMF